MYPLFSSVSLGSVHVLHDLSVAPDGRRHGVGAALLEFSRRWVAAENARDLTLSTGPTPA